MFKKKDYATRLKIGWGFIIAGVTLMLIMTSLRLDYTGGQYVGYSVAGLILTILGIATVKSAKKQRKEKLKDFSAGFEIDPEYVENQTGSFVRGFRDDFAKFFTTKGIEENSDVQNDTTQIFKNVIDLQKRRLDKLGMKMEFRSIRKMYTENPVHTEERFDGKYQITDVDEEIEAKRRFFQNEKEFFARTSNQVAHYTVLDAKRTDDSDTVICPSCGNATTRENLIDGCDYCGTKFRVEDLGKKISAFSLRDKFEIAYAKYKSLRWDYAGGAIMGIFFVIYIVFVLCIILALSGEAGDGTVENPLFWEFSLLIIGGCFAGIFAVPFAAAYMAVIFPALDISASFKYNSKKKIQALKDAEAADLAFAQKIRQFDPQFSAEDFKTNVQNKISTIIFAENQAQINTFAETDLSGYLTRYGNVFDYDIDKMSFLDYQVEDGLQKATLVVKLSLFRQAGKKVKIDKDQIRIKLAKSADCKTQAVCAPSVMRCSGCGNSLSFANGLVCEYCGARVDLKKYDWVITEYK